MSSFSITSLTRYSAAENMEPISEFRLFQEIALYRSQEYWWGLELGDIDINSRLNRVSVRGDIERLLSESALTLVPTMEVVDAMLKLTAYNKKHSVHERRQCFNVLPDQSYQYRLVPGNKMKEQIPLFAFDSSSGTFQRFNYPYKDLPLFTLTCYPFHSVMHNDHTLSCLRPIDETSLAIFKLCIQLASRYPHTGSFVTSPRVAAIIAAHAAADEGYDPYIDLEGTSGEDDDMISGSDTESSSGSESESELKVHLFRRPKE